MFAHFFSLYRIAIRNAIIRAVTTSFPSVQTFFFTFILNYPYPPLWIVKYMQRHIYGYYEDVLYLFIVYTLYFCQLFISEFINLFMLLFLLCRKASQISKMQKHIRLLCPNWTRKTLNNVAHLFLVILNATQKNGHNRPCRRARSHFCRRRCSPHLWRLLLAFASFR